MFKLIQFNAAHLLLSFLVVILNPSPAHALFQDNPEQVTLIDVVSCLLLFQNPGANLNSEQIALGVRQLLDEEILPESFLPLPTPSRCNFLQPHSADVLLDLADVIAVLVVFQNPGVTLSPQQLISGVNEILGTYLPVSTVYRIPGVTSSVATFSPSVPAGLNPGEIMISIQSRTFPDVSFSLRDSNQNLVTFGLAPEPNRFSDYTTFLAKNLTFTPLLSISQITIPQLADRCVIIHRAGIPPPAGMIAQSLTCF